MSEKYELIDEEKDTMTPGGQKKYTTAAMCGWLEVSTAGYYEWRDRPASATSRRRDWPSLLIAKAFTDSDETYGRRRDGSRQISWAKPWVRARAAPSCELGARRSATVI